MRFLFFTGLIITFLFTSLPAQDINKSAPVMNQQFKVAAVQAAPVYLNKAQTVKKACKLIKEAADHGARMVVFPEAFIPGYPDWIWLIPNSKSADLNALYLELVRNSVSESDESIQQIAAAA